ncbi:MAG: phosphohydrolase [candidate division Zixibacteria bacterium SM23_81]|nr:MAG: phosphohydrolase [candidate division Zixibacteria bacterium SM23_81]
MDRFEALNLVRSHVKNKNLVKHMLATEAVMRKLAQHFGEDEELWGLTGLLHDLDYDQTVNDFPRHGLVTAEILEGLGIEEGIIDAIKAHPGHREAKTRLDKALYAVDPLTGLIVAATLMHPGKKLKEVDVQFVLNRFKEKRFAAGANREQIKSCESLGLSLASFVQLALEAMQTVDQDLGL